MGDRARVLELGQALTRAYSSDAHFTQYRTPNGRRLGGDALDHGPVVLEAVAFDWDCHEVHGTPTPAPEAWRSTQRALMASVYDAHPGVYYYETRGGCRAVWRQPTPTILRCAADARSWRQDYLICVAYFRRRFGLELDPACADWTRLFRLPRATRTPDAGPENWLTVGAPAAIGALVVEPIEADLALATRTWPKAFGVPTALDFPPCLADAQGLLFHVLRARGDVIRPHGNAYVVRCPREPQHSCGSTGDGSTFLYLPAAGEQIGAIHCLHAHCAGLDVRDWLREFTREELHAARRAAGIERAA